MTLWVLEWQWSLILSLDNNMINFMCTKGNYALA